MSDEYILHEWLRMSYSDDVAQTARIKIKKEAVAIAEFNHDAGTSLVTAWGEWYGTHE
jgi:hypothetical protein